MQTWLEAGDLYDRLVLTANGHWLPGYRAKAPSSASLVVIAMLIISVLLSEGLS